MRWVGFFLAGVAVATRQDVDKLSLKAQRGTVSWEGSHMKISLLKKPEPIQEEPKKQAGIDDAMKQVTKSLVSFTVAQASKVEVKQSPLQSRAELDKALRGLSKDCETDFKAMITNPQQQVGENEELKKKQCTLNKGRQCATKSVVTGDSVDEQTGHKVKVTYELEGQGCVPTTCYENTNDLRIVARFLRKQAQRMRTEKQAPVDIALTIDCTSKGGAFVESNPGGAAATSLLAVLASMLFLM